MKKQLGFRDWYFCLGKQQEIRSKALIKRDISKKINVLQAEMEYLDADIENARYSIRRVIGRE